MAHKTQKVWKKCIPNLVLNLVKSFESCHESCHESCPVWHLIWKYSSSSLFLFSAHFDASCYTKDLAGELVGFNASRTKQFPGRGSVPTLDTVVPIKPPEVTASEKRKLSMHRQYAVDLYAMFIVTMTIEYGFTEKTH